MIDPGEGYRLLTAGERITTGDEFVSRISGLWTQSTAAEIGFEFDDDCQPFRRKLQPVDASIERLRTAMDQSPYWAAALLQDLPQQLRNDIATVLTHFIGDKQ